MPFCLSLVQVIHGGNAERFSRYNANQKVTEDSEEKRHNLLDLFSEDAYIRKSSSGK